MTCPPDPPTDGYLLGPRCLGSKWVLMSAGAISHSGLWLNWSDPIDIDSVTFKAITLSKRWTSHHCSNADSWLATNYKEEEPKTLLGEGGGGKGRRDWEEAREKHGVREGRMSSGGAGRVGGESSAETLLQRVGTGTAPQAFAGCSRKAKKLLLWTESFKGHIQLCSWFSLWLLCLHFLTWRLGRQHWQQLGRHLPAAHSHWLMHKPSSTWG